MSFEVCLLAFLYKSYFILLLGSIKDKTVDIMRAKNILNDLNFKCVCVETCIYIQISYISIKTLM